MRFFDFASTLANLTWSFKNDKQSDKRIIKKWLTKWDAYFLTIIYYWWQIIQVSLCDFDLALFCIEIIYYERIFFVQNWMVENNVASFTNHFWDIFEFIDVFEKRTSLINALYVASHNINSILLSFCIIVYSSFCDDLLFFEVLCRVFPSLITFPIFIFC